MTIIITIIIITIITITILLTGLAPIFVLSKFLYD